MVDVSLNAATIVCLCVLFVFTVFLFPTLVVEAQNVNPALPLAPLVQAFPMIFVVAVVGVSGLLVWEGKDK